VSSPANVHLDVRPVEPKDRFEAIMGAYESLGPGATLDLVVDHDPKCMYYTLRATRGEAEFTFRYLEDGPEVWRVEVTRAGEPPPQSGGSVGDPRTDGGRSHSGVLHHVPADPVPARE
jgi:uncharacterized protein (DUF2249 family)